MEGFFLLLLTPFIFSNINAPRPCSRDFEFERYGICFSILEGFSESWDDSEQICNEWFLGSHLISIHTSEENDFILQQNKNSEFDFWIGLYRDEEGIRKWYDETEVDFLPSSPHKLIESTSSDRQCYYMNNQAWVTSDCDRYLRIGCEYEIPFCFGEIGSGGNACSGHGSCVSNDICVCDDNYENRDCNYFLCDGMEPENPEICMKRGKCLGHDLCDCDYPYFGKSCSHKIYHPKMEFNYESFRYEIIFSYTAPTIDWYGNDYPPVNNNWTDANIGRSYCEYYIPDPFYESLGSYPECLFIVSENLEDVVDFVIIITDSTAEISSQDLIQLRIVSGGYKNPATFIIDYIPPNDDGNNDDDQPGELIEGSAAAVTVSGVFGVLFLVFGIILICCCCCCGCMCLFFLVILGLIISPKTFQVIWRYTKSIQSYTVEYFIQLADLQKYFGSLQQTDDDDDDDDDLSFETTSSEGEIHVVGDNRVFEEVIEISGNIEEEEESRNKKREEEELTPSESSEEGNSEYSDDEDDSGSTTSSEEERKKRKRKKKKKKKTNKKKKKEIKKRNLLPLKNEKPKRKILYKKREEEEEEERRSDLKSRKKEIEIDIIDDGVKWDV